MLRRILLASAATMALTGVALAEPPIFAPLLAPYNWTGFNLGVQLGGTWGLDNPRLFTPGTEFSEGYRAPSFQGVIGGGQIGYNLQIGQGVVGLVGDVNGTSFGQTFNPFQNKLNELKTIIYSTSKDIEGSIRGLVGYACADYPILVYATGGVAFAGVRNTYDSTAFNDLFIRVDRTHVGWTVGGGAKYAVTPNWNVGVEYRYTEFDFTDSSPLTNIQAEHKLNQNIVLFVVGYKFNSDWFAPL